MEMKDFSQNAPRPSGVQSYQGPPTFFYPTAYPFQFPSYVYGPNGQQSVQTGAQNPQQQMQETAFQGSQSSLATSGQMPGATQSFQTQQPRRFSAPSGNPQSTGYSVPPRANPPGSFSGIYLRPPTPLTQPFGVSYWRPQPLAYSPPSQMGTYRPPVPQAPFLPQGAPIGYAIFKVPTGDQQCSWRGV